ncbi:MAG: hypothetical protein J3K34DRAFT_481358 [Monoraphidium minutum]|nr:MAG: hypothetical protein J3K34DRAFT_481358 [Monoraphidium minutum]
MAPPSPRRPNWRGTAPTLGCWIAFCVLLSAGAGAAPQRAATAWSPFYTAMVNLTIVPAYKAPLKPAPSAAARRAAGYPISAAYSRPALQRDWRGPDDLDAGLEGPSQMPMLPEVGRRRLMQTSAAVLPLPGAATAAARPAAGGAPGCADGAGCFTPRGGFSGLDAPPAGTMGLAVGRRQAVQVAGGVMTVFALGATGTKSSVVRTVALQKLFAAVAPSCDGVHDGAAVYDKHADRFAVAASCGGFGRLLVAASATPDAAGTWFMFGLIADAVNTPLECKAPQEQALADYPQLGYNKDALFVSYYSYCPSRPSVGGASVLALPKYKAYQARTGRRGAAEGRRGAGAPSMYYAVYTAAEVAAAAQLPGGAASVRQLLPVLPQSAGDVEEGVAYFVADVSGAARRHLPRPGAKRDTFTLAAITNTGALWGYVAGLNGVPAPTLVATTVPWGREAPIFADAVLRQPGGAPDLQAGGTTPRGFWSGGAALSRGKILVAARGDVSENGGVYSPRPGVVWAEVAPRLGWRDAEGDFNGTEPFEVPAAECPAAVASGMAKSFDWSKDFSLTYGSEFARNWSWSLNAFRAAAATRPTAPRGATRAAGVVLNRASAMAEAAKTSPAANAQAMAFPRGVEAAGGKGGKGGNGASGYHGRGGNCGCENSCGWGDMNTYNYVYYFDDYCDAGYNQWGPESGNDMFGSSYNGAYCVGDSSFGLVGNHQFDECWRWCLIRCPGNRGGAEGHVAGGYGFYGATNNYPSFFYASVKENATSADAANGTAALAGVAEPAPEAAARAGGVGEEGAAAPAAPLAAPTAPMMAAACTSVVELGAELLRSGTVDPGAALGLAHAAVAVAPNSAAVVSFTFSGPGRTADDMADANPGVGAAFIDAAAAGAVPMTTLQRAAAPVAPFGAGFGAAWGELGAADVHPVTGAVYVAARRGGLTRTARAHVSTWVGVLPMALS